MKLNSQFLRNLSTKRYLAFIRSFPNFREEKVQTYATLILTLLAFSFFALFAIGPTLSTISELRKTLADNTFLDAQLQTKITSMTQLQQTYTVISPQLPVLMAAIPAAPDTTKLSGQIRALAKENSVTITQLQSQGIEIASSTKAKSVLQPIPLTFSVQGDLPNLESFYNSLLSFDRILTITSMTMLFSSEGGTPELRLIIQANAYFRP